MPKQTVELRNPHRDCYVAIKPSLRRLIDVLGGVLDVLAAQEQLLRDIQLAGEDQVEIVRRHYDRLKLPMPDNADRFALYAFRDALKLLHGQLSEAASKLPKPIATCEEMVTLLSAMGNAASEPAALKMAVAALHELIFRMGVVAVGRPSTELDSQNAVALFIRLVIQCESVNDPVADADVEELIDKARRTSSSVGRGRPSAHHHLAWALQSAEGKSAEVIAANHRTLTGKSVQPASVGKCVERFVNRATSAEVRRAVWLQLHATSD